MHEFQKIHVLYGSIHRFYTLRFGLRVHVPNREPLSERLKKNKLREKPGRRWKIGQSLAEPSQGITRPTKSFLFFAQLIICKSMLKKRKLSL